ncbi:hypothetical protein CPB84DRAFT_1761475 [Gymnopilus junonius]|uniref:Fumarylacetoacetase-like C-terminal domain-containing protein n=1 Tax=Gymnopilus junonius TaxID=109634 RepID=A0A9P5P2S0_GYMJU|nr:hypothetical protein CPB84DRAFT_1761475 [Gymnopilus junonius]
MASSFARTGKKIVAIGRNYAAHAKELNNAVPKEPFFFLKPTSSYLPSDGKLEIPQGIVAHHEVELGIVIGKGGRDIPQANAFSHIAGYSTQVKKAGLPWSAAKGFDTFTPIGQFLAKDVVKDPHDLRLVLKINGTTKQDGTTADMIFRIPRLIEHISSIMSLEEGDVILTGTPPGVGPVAPGDKVECALTEAGGKELLSLNFEAIQREGGYKFQED